MLRTNFLDTLFLIFTKIWPVTDPEYALMPPVFHIDNYDHCMLYGNEALFCFLSFQLSPKNPENTSHVWNIMQKLPDMMYYNHSLLRHAICVTERCPHVPKNEILNNNPFYIAQLAECYSENFKSEGFMGEIKQIMCETTEPMYEVNDYDRIFRLFLWIIIHLALFAWIYDLIFVPDLTDLNTPFKKLISAFSIRQNWKRLTKIDVEDPDFRTIRCLQGVRLLNAISVVMSHWFLINTALPVRNTRFMETLTIGVFSLYHAIGGRYNHVQTFFIMSSFLLTFKFCKDIDEKKTMSCSYFLKKLRDRYFRITPLLTIMILMYITCIAHLSRGPLWDFTIGYEYRVCQASWWLNILYINNFIPYSQMCEAHLWSMSVDMQFYVLAVFLLWFFWKYPKKIVWMMLAVWGFHLVGTFYSIKGAQPGKFPEGYFNLTFVNMPDSLNISKASITNIPGSLFGIFFGYIVYKYRNEQLFTKKIHNVLWWVLSWGCIFFGYVTPGIIIHWLPAKILFVFLYYLLSRTIYSFGVGLLIFGVTQGQGGILRDLLEWRPFYVLGRVTYAVYLVHPFIHRIKWGLYRTTIYINWYQLVYNFIGQTVLAFLVAVPVTLLFEMPFEEIRIQMTRKSKITNGKSD